MLPSCGHFKNIPCPFYKLALCVRPHCPYKHQNSENDRSNYSFAPLLDETESLLDSNANLNTVVQKPVFQKRGRPQENVTYVPTPVENISRPLGILKSSNVTSDRSSSYVPEYKPTPIAKLKEFSSSVKSEYSPEYPTTVRKKKNVEEYDPTEVRCIPKKSVTFVEHSGPDDTPIILISSDEELDDSASAPKFSDDDLDDEPSSSYNNTQVPEVITIKQEDELEEPKFDQFSVVDKILVDCKNNEKLLKAYQKPVLSSKINDAIKVSAAQNSKQKIIADKTEVRTDFTSNIKELENSFFDSISEENLIDKLIKKEKPEPSSSIDKKNELSHKTGTDKPEKVKANVKNLDCHSKKSDSHSKKSDSHSKKLDSHSKKSDSHSKKSDSHSKKLDSHSKKSDTHSKKSDTHSKKSDSRSKKSDSHSKKLNSHSKEVDTHSKKSASHSKKSDSFTKKSDFLVKKSDSLSNKSDSSKKSDKSESQKHKSDTSTKKNFSQLKNIDSHSFHRNKSINLNDNLGNSKINTSEYKKSNLSENRTLKEDKSLFLQSEQISDKPLKKKTKDAISKSPTSKRSKIENDAYLRSETDSNKYQKANKPNIKRKHEFDKSSDPEPLSKKKSLSPEENTESDDNEINSDDNFETLELSDSDPEEECRRIYNETFLNPTEASAEDKKQTVLEPKCTDPNSSDLVIMRKKRFAHPAASELKKPVKKAESPFPKKILSPAQVMLNRFKQSQEKYLNENKIVLNFGAKSPERKRINCPSEKLLEAVKNKINQANSVLDNFSPLPPTVSKTLKTTKRVAHIPDVAKKPRPIIPADYGSKVPSNIRQKFLNAFIDECLKFCTTEDEAYEQALEEEKKAFGRSSSKNLYMNVAANTLKRLRNVAQEGPKEDNDNSMSSKGGKKSVSHETVLNGPIAQRHSFSVGRKKEAPEIKGLAELYEYLLPYVLKKEQLLENGYPLPHPIEPDRAVISGVYANRIVYCNDAFKRVCCRCQKTYYVNVDGDYVRDEECDFHWGRLWKKRIAGSIESRYSCCQGDSESDGCCVSPGHVFEGSENHALRGFVKTLPKTPPDDNCYGIYSLDCEMCYTTAGVELTRITVIDTELKTVYESFVKPQNKVLDYNTRFSGITENDLKNVRTTIQDVQAVLLCIFNSKTILIGHSLESDFKALKLFHETVVDTSVVFPHRNGLPFKRALKTLMAEKLNKIIQNDVGGHDSQEDAVACMELMLWKVKEDMRGSR